MLSCLFCVELWSLARPHSLPTHSLSPRILQPKDPYRAGEGGSLHPAWLLAHSSSELSPKRKGPRGRNCEAPPFGLSTSSTFTRLEAESLEKLALPSPSPSFLSSLSFTLLPSLFFSLLLFDDKNSWEVFVIYISFLGTGWASHSNLP